MMKFCLVCSSGGHFLQLYSLRELWEGRERIWVTFPKEDTKVLLEGEHIYWAYHPTNRNIRNLFRNCSLALKVLRKEKPSVVISTGAGVAVPFIYGARLLGIRTIYIESLTRVKALSLTGNLVYPAARHFLVQWPELAQRHRKALYKGQVI
jgi:beta-1,4-N-acetylglucosaminyltransferase